MRRALVAVLVAFSAPLALAPGASAASCGSVSHTIPGTGGHGHAALNDLLAVHVSCHEARRVAREYLAGAFPGAGAMSQRRPVGWHQAVRTVHKHSGAVTEVTLTHGPERVVGDLAN